MKLSTKQRIYLGHGRKEVIDLPDLVGIQTDSYEYFLQRQRIMSGQKPLNQGLEAAFQSTFPIESNDGELIISYDSYILDEKSVRFSISECKKRNLTYSVNVKARLNLFFKSTGEIRQKDIYMGEIPLMTERGTFIINGAERVVVSQIHRSPGVMFSYEEGFYNGKVIPYKGGWLEFELDPKKGHAYVKIDKKKKILITLFLRALGYGNKEQILSLFYNIKELQLTKKKIEEAPSTVVLAKSVYNDKEELLRKSGERLNSRELEELHKLGIKKISIINFNLSEQEKKQYIRSTVLLDSFAREEAKFTREDQIEMTQADALNEIFMGGYGINFLGSELVEQEFQNLFFSEKRYDLGQVGRYRLSQKFNVTEDVGLALTPEDIINVIRYLIHVQDGLEKVDDIDHLGNRRIRSVGELLENVIKGAFAKIEKIVKERMAIKEINGLRPQDLISIKPIVSGIREFFGVSQLSQFMDQINPLAELTHKRRLNALGPGGLNRDRAGFEVRDVHYSHYGRMCPIETPEGQNIGLIVSLTTYSHVNHYGFLETPYLKVVKGRVTDQVEYLSAVEEERYYIAQANAPVNAKGEFLDSVVEVRKSGDYLTREVNDIQYIDLSSKQVVSLSAALIPFLEHDDANRALMGSNMQRQAVPLLFPKSPIVGTGLEARTAYDSGILLKSKLKGKVSYVSSDKIIVRGESGQEEAHYLTKYERTNQDTCFHQKAIVNVGDAVEKGSVLADGPATEKGELALGQNLVMAFLPWNGYNFEDAVLISDRIVKEDVFTSIHIRELVIEVRETKLGVERLTRDIPNVSEKALIHLDEQGIAVAGAKVKSGDILVGKVTPKAEVETTPEFKLLNSIFGEKARDVKDSSLRVPHGVEGTVIDIQRLQRSSENELSPGIEEVVKVLIACSRKLKEGDKIAGRHGNKGIVAKILPAEDMPYMEDGTIIDICLNPLGVPSRMNVGQILESELGLAGYFLNENYAVPVFESASEKEIQTKIEQAHLDKSFKVKLYDGRTGEIFQNPVTIGVMYILKLHHLVDDKMHARSTGPYSLITQQPLGGKAQFGGQRLGEMEVWALEAYGAAYTLQEMLTVKSDDMKSRSIVYGNIVKGELIQAGNIPESFNVLVQELRGLAIDLSVYDQQNRSVALTERDLELSKLSQ